MDVEFTGYQLNEQKQIVGPKGRTGFSLNNENYLVHDGNVLEVYVKDSHFYRAIFLSIYFRTGHVLTIDGQILGRKDFLPWDGLIRSSR